MLLLPLFDILSPRSALFPLLQFKTSVPQHSVSPNGHERDLGQGTKRARSEEFPEGHLGMRNAERDCGKIDLLEHPRLLLRT